MNSGRSEWTLEESLSAAIADDHVVDPPFEIPHQIWLDYLQSVRRSTLSPSNALMDEATRGPIAEWLDANDLEVESLLAALSQSAENRSSG